MATAKAKKKVQKEVETDHRTVSFNDVDMEVHGEWKRLLSEQGMKMQPRFIKLMKQDIAALSKL